MGNCPLCRRDDCILTDHHLVPKSLGGRETSSICRDCHRAIHAYYSNKELAIRFGSIANLKKDKKLSGAFGFIGKRDPSRRARMKRSKSRGKKGKYG